MDWTVKTPEHALNVLRKHYREYHPGETADPKPEALAPVRVDLGPIDLTAASRAVLDLDHAAGWAVWQALTGTAPAEARDLAVSIAEHAGAPVLASLPPF